VDTNQLLKYAINVALQLVEKIGFMIVCCHFSDIIDDVQFPYSIYSQVLKV